MTLEILQPTIMIGVFSLLFGIYVKINETRIADIMTRLAACEEARADLITQAALRAEKIIDLEREKVGLTTQLIEALTRVSREQTEAAMAAAAVVTDTAKAAALVVDAAAAAAAAAAAKRV